MIQILPMQAEHWESVKKIYEEGIATGNATFETSAPTYEVWDTAHLADCRLVALDGGQVAGWAALTPVSGRCVYAGVADISVYVAEKFRGRKIGDLLLRQLIRESERAGLWTLQAGIFPENKASLALHQKNGFEVLGVRKKIGKMNQVWRDTILLERRSETVGV